MEFEDGQWADDERQFDNEDQSEHIEGAVTLESSDEDEDQTQPIENKRYHRHTERQIKRMEEVFKQDPHPDEITRKLLSRELGLRPIQVKFWFQNKRTLLRTQESRLINKQLREENEKLRERNARCWETLRSSLRCPHCSPSFGMIPYDKERLKIENAQIREKIDDMSKLIAAYGGMSLVSDMAPSPFSSAFTPSEESIEDPNHMGVQTITDGETRKEILKGIAMSRAIAAMEEFLAMVEPGEPLWLPFAGPDDLVEKLNQTEYNQKFHGGIEPKCPGFRIEGTRAIAVVFMNPSNLVEILMDVDKWSSFFSSIISRATVMEVLSAGEENYNGSLQLMSVEYQLPSPWVPIRASSFLRYCKKLLDNSWAVVDVSMDSIHPNLANSCRRRPSGCLINPLPSGLLKITWIEHVEVEMGHVYKVFLDYSLAFGANRWVATLDRQFDRLQSVMTCNTASGNDSAAVPTVGREKLLKLAQRMVLSFCSGVTGTTADGWKIVSSDYDIVRVQSRKSIEDPSRLSSIILSVSTSIWLPVLPKVIFDFLSDNTHRFQWDLLSNGGTFEEIANVALGQGNGNSISLLRFHDISSDANTSEGMVLIQENCFDVSCSYVIYAPLPLEIMNGSSNDDTHIDRAQLVSSGFAIVPCGSSPMVGSLLTAAFQIIVDSEMHLKLSPGSTARISNLVSGTLEKVKNLLLGDDASA